MGKHFDIDSVNWARFETEIDGFRERLKLLRKRRVRNDEWFQKRENEIVDADMHLCARNYRKMTIIINKLRKLLCSAEDSAHRNSVYTKKLVFTRKGVRYIG